MGCKNSMGDVFFDEADSNRAAQQGVECWQGKFEGFVCPATVAIFHSSRLG